MSAWTAVVAQGRTEAGTEGSPGLWLDVHARRGRDTTVVILRPALGYYFDRRFSAWAGYALVPTLADGAPDRYEHRAWQQLQSVFVLSGTTLTLRSRVEQRSVQGQDGLGWRVRQLLRLQQTIAEQWAVVAWDEVFLGLASTPWGQPAGFDQNRAFLGLAWMARPNVRIEPGYLTVWLPRFQESTRIHALSVNAFASW